MRPMIDSALKLLTEGRRFTPIGIAVSIALPFVVVAATLFWILGKDGIVQITSAWGESADANKALAAEFANLAREVKALRVAFTSAQAGQSADRVNIAAVCDLTAELNLGKPNDTWCSQDGRSIRFQPPPAGLAAPLHVTAFTWQKVPQ